MDLAASPCGAALGIAVVAGLINALFVVLSGCFGTSMLAGNARLSALLALQRQNLLCSSVWVGIIVFIAALIWAACRRGHFYRAAANGTGLNGGRY